MLLSKNLAFLINTKTYVLLCAVWSLNIYQLPFPELHYVTHRRQHPEDKHALLALVSSMVLDAFVKEDLSLE